MEQFFSMYNFYGERPSWINLWNDFSCFNYMSNFLLYAKARILAEHNIKDGNIFLYFEKKLNLYLQK